VLITFMLASASFLAIGVFDASVAANAASGNDKTKPPAIRIEIELGVNKDVALKVEGKLNIQKKLHPRDGKYDGPALVAELKSLSSRFPDTNGFVLGAADDVEYVELIGMMEVLRTQLPKLAILLGGL